MDFINHIISQSLRKPLLVAVGVTLLVACGIRSVWRMDIDVLPDLTAPTVVVMTDARGMAPEEVERLVTFPIETAVNGAASVRRVRSSSSLGASFVWAEFDWGTDLSRARQTVSEKMSALEGELPEGVRPTLAPQSSVMGEILMIGLQADTTSAEELRSLADWVVKPVLLATGGVSQVTNIGGEVRQFHVTADSRRMAALGVTLEEVEAACRAMARNSTGGVVRDYGNEYALRGIAGDTDSRRLGQALVKTVGGKPVTLSDVATLAPGHAKKTGHASQNGKPAVILAVSKQPGVNTLQVTERIEKSLEAVRPSLPPDTRMDTRIFRQSDFIEASVGNVERSLMEGTLLAVGVLLLFLASLRTTLISVLAIPLSLLGAAVTLSALGMNINTMTLGGMCIAIGSLVDDAIIDVENVYKRLGQNHRLPPARRKPAMSVVYEASTEIRASILNATLIIIVAFSPLFFLSGMEGRMLKPLGTAYIISLAVSLLVAMTVTPLLCLTLLSDGKYLSRKEGEARVTRALGALYRRSLQWTLARGRLVACCTALLVAVAAALLSVMGRSFLPDFNEGSAVVTAVARPGVSLEVNDALGRLMERELLAVPEVTGTARRTGRGDLDEHSQATNGAEIDVRFRLGERTRAQVFDDMRRRLALVPGVAVTIGQPIGHRIDHMLSGTKASIAVKLFGPDLQRLHELGNKVRAATGDVEGLVDVSVEQQVETPQLQARADRQALAAYGITMERFGKFMETAFAGEKIADIYDGQRRLDVVLRLDSGSDGSIESVRGALLDAGVGGKVPLSRVADVVSTGGPGAIARENAQRKLVVSANVSGRDVGSAAEEVRRRVAERVRLPEGYRVEYGGQFESARSATRTLAAASAVALALVFLLLYGEFRDAALAALVLLNLPFALIGGVVAVWLGPATVSIPATIGFITLFGVATRNGILLVTRYRHLTGRGVPPRQAVVEGSADRLSPILMTALTSALALVPLVVEGDKAGNEIQSPMALVVLGGLATSTLLNLYVMPAVYEWYAGRQGRQTYTPS